MTGKRIVLLSDGTGNSAGKVWRTNVWRIFEGLDLTGSGQVACYDDGVGTSSFKPLAVLGGVFGWGLKRNVLTLYEFLSRNYSAGDDIYGFGFSRGAFTIRLLIGLVLSQGLVKGTTDAELHANARLAYRAYRKANFKSRFQIEKPLRGIRDFFVVLFGGEVTPPQKVKPEAIKIKFLGLWDTVAAYGTPIDEMTRGISKWIWPLELPNRQFDHEKLERCCHALAVDEERTTFQPVLWNENGVPEGQLTQVWFSGVHSNVGGGYPDDSLAYISLYWIMEEAKTSGLSFKTTVPALYPEGVPASPAFDPDVVVHARSTRDKDGRLYDSRNGMGGYYRYGPRKIEELNDMRFSGDPEDYVEVKKAKIHETVIKRARSGAHAYAPIGIPSSYDVISDSGTKAQSDVEPADDCKRRCDAQESVWNLVWRRRVVYFLTVLTSVYLAVYPLARAPAAGEEFSTRLSLVSGLIRLIGKALPSILDPWVEAYARDPSHFVTVGVLVAFLIWLGSHVGNQIQSRMQSVWRPESKVYPDGLAWNLLFAAACIFGFFGVLFPWFDNLGLLSQSTVAQLQLYITSWMRVVFSVLLFAFLLPEFLILRLRLAGIYRGLVQFTKLEFAPGLIALSLICTGLMFFSHLVFNIEEAFGFVCEESDGIAQLRAQNSLGKAINDFGLGACKASGLPTCHGRAPVMTAVCPDQRKPQCSKGEAVCNSDGIPMCGGLTKVDKWTFFDSSGPAICPADCEKQTKQFDVRSVCTATKIWLEEGQSYHIRVVPDQTIWKDDKKNAGARGYYLTDLKDFKQKLLSTLIWPLKRSYFEPNFRVIARVGATGNNEEPLLPDPIAPERKAATPTIDDVTLDVTFRPKSSGELFLYVNENVFAWPGLWDFFYTRNFGTAKVTVSREMRANL